jgi:hypothetical protein
LKHGFIILSGERLLRGNKDAAIVVACVNNTNLMFLSGNSRLANCIELNVTLTAYCNIPTALRPWKFLVNDNEDC